MVMFSLRHYSMLRLLVVDEAVTVAAVDFLTRGILKKSDVSRHAWQRAHTQIFRYVVDAPEGPVSAWVKSLYFALHLMSALPPNADIGGNRPIQLALDRRSYSARITSLP